MAGRNRDQRRTGFTLVELLVVIGIIALLIGILIPVVHKVQISGRIADTKNWLNQLTSAIDRYHTDFRAFPGPISNLDVYNNTNAYPVTFPTAPTGYDNTGFNQAKITMSENLFLGLAGGLKNTAATGAAPNIQYDPTTIGLGPASLNPVNPKRSAPYIDVTNTSMHDVVSGGSTVKSGHFSDDAGDADDTVIPEFLDRFTDAMPILYMRSKLGVDVVTAPTATNNSVITDATGATPPRPAPYDLGQIIGYTGSFTGTWPTLTLDKSVPPSGATKCIGVGKKMPTAFSNGNAVVVATPYHGLRTVDPTAVMDKTNSKYQYPYDAFPYFQSPNTPNVPRQKDGYILISPGPDRIYGTNDDICSFGDVAP